MNAVICLDDNNGMMFNNRRQSRDSAVNERILRLAEGAKLWMNAYSSKLFPERDICIAEDFLHRAEKGDFCFIENGLASLDNIEELYVFLWNRRYPADVYFVPDPEKDGFTLVSSEEFGGSSHEKITLNVYRRK